VSLIGLARRDRAYDAVAVLEAEKLRLQEMDRSVPLAERNGVRRFLNAEGKGVLPPKGQGKTNRPSSRLFPLREPPGDAA